MVNPEPQKSAEQTISRASENVRRWFFWCIQYWRELFNFRFDKYMIVQVLPGVYAMMLIALLFTIIGWCVLAFMQNPWFGVFVTLVPAPLAFLVSASVLRALLEFYLVVFKISEHVDELVGLRDTVDRLSGISDTVDEMVSVTRRIPFWKAMSGRSRRRVPQDRRRTARPPAEDEDEPDQP